MPNRVWLRPEPGDFVTERSTIGGGLRAKRRTGEEDRVGWQGIVGAQLTFRAFGNFVVNALFGMNAPVASPRPSRIMPVDSFDELADRRFGGGVNAFCWKRTLPGDFGEVVAQLGRAHGVVALDEARLQALKVGAAGRLAIETMLADLRRLDDRGLDPVLNQIESYPRDEEAGPVSTDVFSFHADRASIEAETWLCTYHGAPSEGLDNDEAIRRVNVPSTRAALLQLFGGPEGDEFEEFLRDHCYDLHYAPLPHARPFSFGVGHLWRIACDFPDSPVPPCIHRAPMTGCGSPSRLLLIC